jgi:two-component system cell cycle response regulator DivK
MFRSTVAAECLPPVPGGPGGTVRSIEGTDHEPEMTQVSGRPTPSGSPPPPFALEDAPRLRDQPRRRPVVLLVDDIEDCRDVYGQFLRHVGYEVAEAADGREALARAGAVRPDVIVMDLWMPDLDGWEAIRRLKASPATAKIPVLVLTGDAYAQARSDAQDAGCEAYLVKPCLPMDVAAVVGRLAAAARAGAPHPEVRVLSERRSGGRRRSETGGGVLAAVVEDVERRYQEAGRHLRAIESELRAVPGLDRTGLPRHLERFAEAQDALGRHIEALKVIARSADIKITIPARRGPRKP